MFGRLALQALQLLPLFGLGVQEEHKDRNQRFTLEAEGLQVRLLLPRGGHEKTPGICAKGPLETRRQELVTTRALQDSRKIGSRAAGRYRK